MAFTADIVKETSTTTGTGTLNLDGVVSGFLGFVAAIGTGNQCYYSIAHRTAAEREVGIGTVTDGTPDTLSRTTVLSSTNGGALVNFSAGTKDVFITFPAAKVPLLDTANVFTANQTISNAAPSLILTDTTGSAKSLTVAVDANLAQLRESAGASGSLLVLDLANNRVGMGTVPGTQLHVKGVAGSNFIPKLEAPTGYGTYLQIGNSTDGLVELVGLNSSGDFALSHYGVAGNVFYSTRSGATANTLILSQGKVGLGMTPTQQLELSGSVGQKASGTTWSNPSDARLKDSVRDYTDGLDVIRKIRPVHYMLNGLAGTPKGTKGISIIAQEMLEVMPYTIETYKAKLHPEDVDDTELYRFEASAVTFALVNAVKELATRLEKVEAWMR